MSTFRKHFCAGLPGRFCFPYHPARRRSWSPVRARGVIVASLGLSFFAPLTLKAGESKSPEDGNGGGGDAPANASGAVVDALDMGGIQEAFRVLRSQYIDRSTLTPIELNRAALEGVLERLGFGASLISGENESDRGAYQSHFRAESLIDEIAYLRPVTFKPGELSAFDEALLTFSEKGAETLILDLRAPAGHGEFEIAAEIADRFIPEGNALFKITRPGNTRPRIFVSKKPPLWNSGRLIILLDGDSNNVAETVAAVLQQQVSPFIVGTRTRGDTVEYNEAPIGAGLRLRLASAEMLLPDGTSLFKEGLTPDFAATVSGEHKEAFFSAPPEQDVNTFVFEAQRPRLNEAALVAGTNPELPYIVKRSLKEPTEFDDPPVVDTVLQRTVDFLTLDSFLPTEEVEGGKDGDAANETGQEEETSSSPEEGGGGEENEDPGTKDDAGTGSA